MEPQFLQAMLLLGVSPCATKNPLSKKKNDEKPASLKEHKGYKKQENTHLKFKSSPLKSYLPNREVVFQLPFFQG